jgi:serine/threonine-protein kinase
VAVRIVLDVAAGLSAVHEWVGDDGAPLGLLHRDVSPQNVLVGIDGTTKLTDFGLARLVHGAESSRTTGQMQGKAAYVAPEYVDGAPYTVACEVFALGVVLWETVACRRLFRGANEADTLRRVMAAEAPPLSKVAPQVGTALDALLEKALAKSPERRFPTVRAFLDALQAAARKNDLMAISSEVGSCVRDRIGPALEKRRSLVRAGLAVAGSSPAAAGGFSETVSMVMDESGVPSIIGEGSRHAAIGEVSRSSRSRDDSGEATLVAPPPRHVGDESDDAVTTDFNKLPEDARAVLAAARGQAPNSARRPTPLPPPPRSRPSGAFPPVSALPPAGPALFRDATPDRAMTRILPLMPIPGLDGQTPVPFVPQPPVLAQATQPPPVGLAAGLLDRNRPLPRAAYLAIASVAILIAIAILVSPASPPPDPGAAAGGSRADAPPAEPPPPPQPTSVVTLGPILPPAPPTPAASGPAVIKLPDLPSVPTGVSGPSHQLGRARLPPRIDPPPPLDDTDGSTPPPNPYKKR